jgi:hypothetical protein
MPSTVPQIFEGYLVVISDSPSDCLVQVPVNLLAGEGGGCGRNAAWMCVRRRGF